MVDPKTGESLETLRDQLDYAQKTADLANGLWALAVPWKFFPWRRQHKEVYRRLALSATASQRTWETAKEEAHA